MLRLRYQSRRGESPLSLLRIIRLLILVATMRTFAQSTAGGVNATIDPHEPYIETRGLERMVRPFMRRLPGR
jgi:hypothetical protein